MQRYIFYFKPRQKSSLKMYKNTKTRPYKCRKAQKVVLKSLESHKKSSLKVYFQWSYPDRYYLYLIVFCLCLHHVKDKSNNKYHSQSEGSQKSKSWIHGAHRAHRAHESSELQTALPIRLDSFPSSLR